MLSALILSLSCLTGQGYLEAADQSIIGQIIAMQTVTQRVQDSRYPDSTCDVVYDGVYDSKGRVRLHRCQYSALCDGLPEVYADKQAYGQAFILAALVLSGYMPTLIPGAIHYHEICSYAYWAEGQWPIIVEDHAFYIGVR